MQDSEGKDSYPLSITFVGWTNSFALTVKWNEMLWNKPCPGMPERHPPRVGAPPGDYAILTITNHGEQFLRFDSVGVEYELNGAWVNVNLKNWPGLHGTGWITTQSDVHLQCPAEVPCNAPWRVRYTCDLDPDPTLSANEARPAPVAPVLMVTPILPARPHHSAAARNLSDCHWCDLHNIGCIMQSLVQDVRWETLRPVAWAWLSETGLHARETRSPGAFAQSLVSYLRSAGNIGQFHGLLGAMIERLRGDPERSKTLAAAVRIQNHIRSGSAEPGTAPNWRPCDAD